MYNFNSTHIKRFTIREVSIANRTQKLYHGLNEQLIPSLKIWIGQNMAYNIPEYFKDVDLAEKVSRADFPTLKRKGKRPHSPVTMNEDMIDLLKESHHKGNDESKVDAD